MNLFANNPSTPETDETRLSLCTACQPDGVADDRSLAMVYSPKQQFRSLYSHEEAMKHGTLFEELYKPILTANGTMEDA